MPWPTSGFTSSLVEDDLDFNPFDEDDGTIGLIVFA
jgi:hypothetical protein